MPQIFFVIMIAASLLVTGCELHQVKGEVAGVEVQASTKDSGAGFCPPGQAKKGNC